MHDNFQWNTDVTKLCNNASEHLLKNRYIILILSPIININNKRRWGIQYTILRTIKIMKALQQIYIDDGLMSCEKNKTSRMDLQFFTPNSSH